jgi:hypothetical protein
MSSLFPWTRNPNPEMLKIPAFCIPAEESAKLLTKREDQLAWMRAKGVQYILGRPVTRQKSALPRNASPQRPVQLHSVRRVHTEQIQAAR